MKIQPRKINCLSNTISSTEKVYYTGEDMEDGRVYERKENGRVVKGGWTEWVEGRKRKIREKKGGNALK